MLPSPHLRDPRRRYRANQIRKRTRPAVPPIVLPPVSDTLVSELIRVGAQTRAQFLLRIEREKGPEHAQAILSAVADALRKKRTS